MELWEFNLYCKGYKERLFTEQVNLITLAYNTGMFTKAKKSKSLEYYIDKLKSKFYKDKYRNNKVDTKKSMSIYEQIEKLKGSEKNGR